MNLVRLFVWCALLTTAGCGLDHAGLGADPPDGDTSGGGDAVTMGASDDGGVSADRAIAEALAPFAEASDGASPATDASPIDSAGGDVVPIDAPAEGSGSCQTMIPSGWSLVVYDLAGNMCPPNFGAHEVYGTPVVDADACPCTCTLTQDGSCTQGPLSTLVGHGNGSTCPTSWLSVAISGSACTPVTMPTGAAPTRFQASALPGQGGTCSDDPVQPDATEVSAPPARFCDVPAGEADAVCNGTVPSGFSACIVTSGTAACPPGTPFMQPYIVEDAVTPQCSACSPCSVATTCANAVLTVYTDSSCGGSGGSGAPLTVDGTCADVSGAVSSVSSVTYTATESSACTPGSSTPAAQLMNPQTICCR